MSDDKATTNFTVHNCPRSLVGRVKAKAALVGQDQEKWVIELLQRETKKLKSIQTDYKIEEQQRSKDDDSN